MTSREPTKKLTIEKLQEISEHYNQERLVVSSAYQDAGIEGLWSRFERGVLNQIDGGEAMASRYAIWANTVRDNIIEGMKEMEYGNPDKARHYFTQAANSLSAFSDVQAYFDPYISGNRQ